MARLIVIMGVSGCGKSTVAKAMTEQRGWPYLDADDFHSARNIEKMTNGEPLSNDDRRAWIRDIRQAINERTDATIMLACSALNPTVRDWLTHDLDRDVIWCWLCIDQSMAQDRVQMRTRHFMPAALVASQFETLDPPAEAWQIDSSQSLECIFKDLNTRFDRLSAE